MGEMSSRKRKATVSLTANAFVQAAECLKVLAHPHRLQMVQSLLEERRTVGELAEMCSIPHNVASEHLRLMQRCGFLVSQRESRFVYYSACEPHLLAIMKCIESRFGSIQ
jgi:ArsR family transcriptional regulator, zinc-responsive transcriptional repressor